MRLSVKIFFLVNLVFYSSLGFAEVENPVPDEDALVVDEIYDNPNLKFTDATKILFSEKSAIEDILSDLHKLRKHKRKSWQPKNLPKNMRRKSN